MEVNGGNRISQIKRLSDRIFERILDDKGIDAFNGAQGRILYILWQEDNISLRDISERTSLAPTTLTSMIDRMEEAGLVNRVSDSKDRRKTLLALTDKARKLHGDYMEVSSQMTRIFYSGFTEEEIGQCEELLEKIYNNLKSYNERK
mgnify:FL=1